MFRLICIVIGYCIGCLQTAYFVGKYFKVDIRQYGSGNLGSTNALRVLGKKAGLITFVCDILKSVIGFWVCRLLFQSELAGFYGSLGVILGHDFPFYLKFKGGKGIACMIGMMLCINGYVMLITFVFGILGLLTRYVSVGSMAFSVTIPIAFAVTQYPVEFILLATGIATLAIYQHRANIQRLLKHTENKLGAKKS